MRYAPMFMAYQRYVLNYEPAKLQLKELAGKVNGVSLLIHNFCTTAKVISLDTFLILPIQRLTRYEMLLGNILKQTSQRHDDFENLLHSLSTLKEINDDINKKKEEADNAKRLEEIESNLIEDHYAIPKNLWEVRNRVYIREGSLFDNSGTWSKRRTAYYYFMFSDIMIKTRTVNRKKRKRHQICLPRHHTVQQSRHWFGRVAKRTDGRYLFLGRKKATKHQKAAYSILCLYFRKREEIMDQRHRRGHQSEPTDGSGFST